MLIWDCPNVVNEWVAAQNGGFAAPGYCTALGWMDVNKRLVGGVVFHSTNGASCLVNIALTEGVFPIPLLRASLDYAFNQLQLRRLTFIIKEVNIRSINLVTALGATREATLREADPSGNLLIFALFPEDCSVWRKLNGKKQRQCSSSTGPSGNDSASNAGE